MSKLNKLKLSGTTYELQDLSAQPLLSAGTGIQISGNVISCTGGGGGNPTVELTQAEYDALVSAGTVSQNTYYIITDAQEIDTTNYWTSAQTQSAITQATSGKQDTLISGTNIKTVNNESLLGSGNITIQGGGVNVVQTTGTSTTDVMSQNAVTSTKMDKGEGVIAFNLASIANGNMVQYQKTYPIWHTLMLIGEINGTKIATPTSFSLVETSAITTSMSSSSTDAQVPSAKAVFDAMGGLKLVKLSQAEYDALVSGGTVDANTLYIITNVVS